MRADGDAGLAEVKVVPMGKGMHVTLGPAVILYRASTRGSGPFHTLATFTQTRKTPHPEGYGLFYGGQLLEGGGEKYTYFLVRGDGSYLIKRRDGEQTTNITKGWVPSPAVHKLSAKGTATNLLEIDNKRDPSKVVFMVNGQPVHTLEPAADVDGIVGIRHDGHDLIVTPEALGLNDGRVDPWHSRKMAARLQAATSSSRPVYLRISMDTGHGQGTALATQVEEDADRFDRSGCHNRRCARQQPQRGQTQTGNHNVRKNKQ